MQYMMVLGEIRRGVLTIIPPELEAMVLGTNESIRVR